MNTANRREPQGTKLLREVRKKNLTGKMHIKKFSDYFDGIKCRFALRPRIQLLKLLYGKLQEVSDGGVSPLVTEGSGLKLWRTSSHQSTERVSPLVTEGSGLKHIDTPH